MSTRRSALHPAIDNRLRDLATKAEEIAEVQIGGLKRQLDACGVPSDMQVFILLGAARKAEDLAMTENNACRRARREGR